MTALTANPFIADKNEMTPGNLIGEFKKAVRNWMIDKRINRLKQFEETARGWASLTEAERTRQVRVISSIRHAIYKMEKMKS